MKAFWSRIARELSPYMPGEQPRIANLVKLNTNESPFGASPLALEAMRSAAVDTLRLYPDPEAQELREALAVHHGIKPEQVFVGNGSDAKRALSSSVAKAPLDQIAQFYAIDLAKSSEHGSLVSGGTESLQTPFWS